MKRAAIYARFSSDRQNEKSCKDQINLCSAWAERNNCTVVDTFQDQAISGASTINRFGLASLMRAAREKRFDVVIAEALDRLSRDQADLGQLRKELTFLGIGIFTVQDGEVGAIHIGGVNSTWPTLRRRHGAVYAPWSQMDAMRVDDHSATTW